MSSQDQQPPTEVEETATDPPTAPRVGRPRRYTTDQVIMAAIDLADEGGVQALSMPQLAKRLRIGTMTLYGYVGSKQELLDKMAEKILETVDLPQSDDWRESLHTFFSDFRRIALAHPALAGLLGSGRINSPRAAEALEIILEEMTEAGAPIEEAVRTFYAALTYTIGFVIWEIPRAHLQEEWAYAEQWASSLAQLDPNKFPALTGPAAEVAPTVASSQQFDWGLDKIIDSSAPSADNGTQDESRMRRS